MGLKLGQNINFRPFLGFCSVFGRDTGFLVATQSPGRDTSCLVAIQSPGRDTVSWSPHSLLVATQVFWSRHSLLVATQSPGRDIISWSRHNFLDSSWFFFSLTCRGHNFFVSTRIWACEYSLESSLNLECIHEGI